MRRPLCSILALGFAFTLLAGTAEARRGGGGYRGGHAGGYRGGYYGGRGYGWGGVALGLGVGAALAYRGWGWWGDYPGYAYGYGAWPYAGPAYQQAPMAPPAGQPSYVGKPAQSQEPVGMCRTNTLNVSCRLPQPLAPGAGCGCPSNMGMLPGQAAP